MPKRTRALVPVDEEQAAMHKWLQGTDLFAEIRGTMPLQYMRAFLLVAFEEGCSVSEYAIRAGVSNSVMSRHLLDIGERNRHMEKGFGLVYYKPNPMMLREHQVYLTPEGKALKHKLFRIIKVGNL